MSKPIRDMLDPKPSPKKSPPTPRGKAISAHRERHGDATNWSAVFRKLDRSKRTSKG